MRARYLLLVTFKPNQAAAEALDARAIQQRTSPEAVKLTAAANTYSLAAALRSHKPDRSGAAPSMSPRPASQPPGRVAVTGIGPARSSSKLPRPASRPTSCWAAIRRRRAAPLSAA